MTHGGGGALLVAGTTSDAGKSAVVAGLCRLLARRGVSVAPFKAQNMSNNSAVTPDGGEIGRAQALQAEAAGIEASTLLNPVLLKPSADRRSQVVVRGQAVGTMSAADYHRWRPRLAGEVAGALAELRATCDVVLCEGAGSPAEVNLRGSDIANMGLAAAARMPVVVVGDIDRGGVLAHFLGTLGALSADDQALVAGFVVNKFRGDPALLEPGLDWVRERTGRAVYGVMPFLDELWIDAEDSLGTRVDSVVGRPRPAVGSEALRVAAIRLPRISNSTDVEALACEPGVHVTWVDHPSRLDGVDLVVVPGSKATVSDLAWLRERGLERAITAHAGAGGAVLGVCGGFQMLGRRIVDSVESAGPFEVSGLDLLDVDVAFAAEKTVRAVAGIDRGLGVPGDRPVSGYEIHHGQVVRSGERPLLELESPVAPAEPATEGARRGGVFGTHWHGLLAGDEYRRAFLAAVARHTGRRGFVAAPDTSLAAVRTSQLDLLADALESHVDVDALLRLADEGVVEGLPALRIGLDA